MAKQLAGQEMIAPKKPWANAEAFKAEASHFLDCARCLKVAGDHNSKVLVGLSVKRLSAIVDADDPQGARDFLDKAKAIEAGADPATIIPEPEPAVSPNVIRLERKAGFMDIVLENAGRPE